jgi:hypothetical protein
MGLEMVDKIQGYGGFDDQQTRGISG